MRGCGSRRFGAQGVGRLALLAVFGVSACYRHVDVSGPEAARLDAHPSPSSPVIVETTDGESRAIEDYDSIIVRSRTGCALETPCVEQKEQFAAPVRAQVQGVKLVVSDETRTQAFDLGNIDRVTVRELALDRTAIIVSATAGATILTGIGAYYALGLQDDSNVGKASLFLLATGAALSLTLVFTIKSTKKLGVEVERPAASAGSQAPGR